MNLRIKKAKKSDLSSILNLLADLDTDNKCRFDLQYAEKIFYKIKTYPNYNIYVAVHKDKIIGTFELLIMDYLAHNGLPSAIIEDVVIYTDYRGHGTGKKMMLFAMEECKEAGCYKMTLSINIIRNQAHHLYESLGFEKHGYSIQINFEKINKNGIMQE